MPAPPERVLPERRVNPRDCVYPVVHADGQRVHCGRLTGPGRHCRGLLGTLAPIHDADGRTLAFGLEAGFSAQARAGEHGAMVMVYAPGRTAEFKLRMAARPQKLSRRSAPGSAVPGETSIDVVFPHLDSLVVCSRCHAFNVLDAKRLGVDRDAIHGNALVGPLPKRLRPIGPALD